VDAPLAQLRVALELPDCVDYCQRRLRRWLSGRVRTICEPRKLLRDPALERPVDGASRGRQIPGDRADPPTCGMETYDGEPPLPRVAELGIRREATLRAGRGRTGGKDLLHGVVGRPSPALDVAGSGDLAQRHAWHLGAQVHDPLAHRRRQATRILHRLPSLLGKQARQPCAVESLGPAIDGPRLLPRCPGPLAGRLAEDHHRPDQRIHDLFGSLQQASQLCPIVGPLMAGALAFRHPRSRALIDQPCSRWGASLYAVLSLVPRSRTCGNAQTRKSPDSAVCPTTGTILWRGALRGPGTHGAGPGWPASSV